ncbi:hypothetical protein K469DRAFT_788479 [Zopfia rhizophila CBS 207.26]|uniref:Stress-response A/B barrel domain-containing protein n=1 Tax=Zopfia rhizophila CBS 207.26 TaxID=1314779 RepID=A0A6A6DS19_9PEZI|nr:hypothetical protein K469DRAFT_788479 [Zopfia rhizophila CBS 207.26]
MTVIHMVFFKFRPEITTTHTILRPRTPQTQNLSCIKDNRLLVGGPSITEPLSRSKGFEFALLSFHHDRRALEKYQASKEHHWVTSTYMLPYKEDLCRFDFEVEKEDEYMCCFGKAFKELEQVNVKGVDTPVEIDTDEMAG